VKINVFGLGYVGCVSAACLANDDHIVTGVDINNSRIQLINKGKSPIIELGLQEAIQAAITAGKLKATVNDIQNIGPADISIVCVGTPSHDNGSLQLQFIQRVAKQIGEFLRTIDSYHVVNIRSTVLPGTVEEVVIPLIEQESEKKAGIDFGVCMNPEFMREGTSIDDYYNPPFTLIGELDKKSGDIVAKLYEKINAPTLRTSIRVAEITKYTCNIFHALKVSFANEIGNICKSLNIDSHQVMDIFCKDTKLNLSQYYLKPGYAFGGSCLPKDTRALLYKAKELDLESPVLSAILRSNNNQIESAYKLVKKTGMKKVGVLGLSFKQGTDDLRESPMVELIEKLIGKGYSVNIFDREVYLAKLTGSNKRYIEQAIPHISSLMKQTAQEVIENSDVIVVGNNSDENKDIVDKIHKNKVVIDLVRIGANPEQRNGYYEGICW